MKSPKPVPAILRRDHERQPRLTRRDLAVSSSLVTARRRKQVTTADVVAEMDEVWATDALAFCVSGHVPPGECWRFVDKGVEWLWVDEAGLSRAQREAPKAFLGPHPVDVVRLEALNPSDPLRRRLVRMAADKLGPMP